MKTASLKHPCLAVLLAFVVSCASARSSASVSEAEAALRRGEYAKATELYDQASSARPSDPLLREMADLSRRLAKGQSAAAAEAKKAKAKADDLVRRGERQLADGEPAAALAKFHAALEYVPEYPPARDAVQRAADAALADVEAEAGALYRRGEAGAALAVFSRAREELGFEAIPAEAAMRREIAGRLRDRMKEAEAADLPMTARALGTAAHEIDPSAGEPEAGEARYGLTVSVAEFEDRTGGRLDPADLRRKLLAALRAKTPIPLVEYGAAAGAPAAGVSITGAIRKLSVEESPPVTKPAVREYVIRTEKRLNQEREALSAQLDALDGKIRDAQSVVHAIERERFEIEQLKISTVYQANRRYGGYSEAAYYRHLANVRARETTVRRAFDRLKASRSRLDDRIREMPVYVEFRILGRADVMETTRTIEARAEGEFSVAVEQDRKSGGGSANAAVSATDTTSPADPSIGLPEDPLELPGAVEIAAQALDKLAEKMARAIAPRVAAARKGLIEKARAEADEDRAVEYYAAFVLTAGQEFPLEANVAAGKFEKRYGFRLTPGGPDVTDLRLR